MTEPSRIPPDGDGQQNDAARMHVTIRMLIPTSRRKEARSILASMIERIQLEEGCLSCRLYQDAMEGNTILFEEIWADERYLQNHLLSDEFRNVLLVVEMASKPPEIRFDRIVHSTGIDAIKDARKPTGKQTGADGLSV